MKGMNKIWPASSRPFCCPYLSLVISGEIDKGEFKKVMALMRSFNRQGAAHRDGLRTGFKVGQSVENGGLVEYFFGNDGNERLHFDKFTSFLKELHEEVICFFHIPFMEFTRHDFSLMQAIFDDFDSFSFVYLPDSLYFLPWYISDSLHFLSPLIHFSAGYSSGIQSL